MTNGLRVRSAVSDHPCFQHCRHCINVLLSLLATSFGNLSAYPDVRERNMVLVKLPP